MVEGGNKREEQLLVRKSDKRRGKKMTQLFWESMNQ